MSPRLAARPVIGSGARGTRAITAPGGAPGDRAEMSADLSPLTRLALFRQMIELRLFEDKAYELFLLGLVKGTTHLAQGQEAVAVGFASAMRTDDYTFCTYRGHDHTLARGASVAKAMGELMGRAGGLLGGKGGSMHLADIEHGAMGSYAIVGAHLPVRISCFVYGAGPVGPFSFSDEVRDAFWVPLAELVAPTRHIMAPVSFGTDTFERPSIRLPVAGKPVLWGITYRLVMQFLEIMGSHLPTPPDP